MSPSFPKPQDFFPTDQWLRTTEIHCTCKSEITISCHGVSLVGDYRREYEPCQTRTNSGNCTPALGDANSMQIQQNIRPTKLLWFGPGSDLMPCAKGQNKTQGKKDFEWKGVEDGHRIKQVSGWDRQSLVGWNVGSTRG